MRRKSYANMDCSVARTLDIVGDPWTLLIVRDVFWGYNRFNDFQERLGIPRNTLTDRLAALVEADILIRIAYQDNPPRFDYRLTERGLALRSVIITLKQWGDRWSGLPKPPVRLTNRETGLDLEPLLVDAVSGQPLDEIKIRVVGPPVEPSSG